MKSGHDAAAFIQRANGVDAAAKTDVQVEGLLCGLLLQLNQRIVVAGINREQVAAWVKRDGKGFFQLGVQSADLGGQPCLGLAFGPQQFVGKFAQSGGLAFFPQDQGLLEGLFPAFEFPPDVAVRQLQRFGGTGNRARFAHCLQHVHQGVAQGAGLVTPGCFALMRCPAVREVDVLHRLEFASICPVRQDAAGVWYANDFIADIPYLSRDFRPLASSAIHEHLY